MAQATAERVSSASVPVSKINITGLNLRREFNEQDLRELGQDVLARGLLQPILVRTKNGQNLYDLIAGERRLRAAKLVGIEKLDARIYDITDAEAEEMMIVENMQREDLHDLDYADGFTKMIDHGYSVAELAKKVNKGETYIRDFLHLGKLPEIARQAFRGGALTKSHCVLIGTIPDEMRRAEFAKQILHTNREPMSFRGAKEWKEQHYMRELKGAPFPLDDKTLDPEWGFACLDCPHYNGNTPESRQGKRADICLNPDHYTKLVRLNSARKLAAIKVADNVTVLPAEKGERLFYAHGDLRDSSYVDSAETVYDYGAGKKSQTVAAIVKQAVTPVTVTVDQSGKVHTLVRKADLAKATKQLGIKTSYSSHSSTAQDKRRAAKKREDNAVKRSLGVAVLERLDNSYAKGFVFASGPAQTARLLALTQYAVRDAPGAVKKFLCRRLDLGKPANLGWQDWSKPLLRDLVGSRMARGRPAYLWGMLVRLQVFSQLNELLFKEWGRSAPNKDDVAMCAAFGVDIRKLAAQERAKLKAAAKLKKAVKR